MIKSIFDLFYYIKSDIFRYSSNESIIKKYFLVPGLKFMIWFRICSYLRHIKYLKFFYYLFKFKLIRLQYRFGIQITDDTIIGPGFYIGHFGAIVVNGKSVIGKNVNISQGVTIGQSNRGEKKGYATIGNEVYIGPGAKIIGSVKIGNNVAIGANAVVTSDLPDNAVAVGIPAKIISFKGASDYIINKC